MPIAVREASHFQLKTAVVGKRAKRLILQLFICRENSTVDATPSVRQSDLESCWFTRWVAGCRQRIGQRFFETGQVSVKQKPDLTARGWRKGPGNFDRFDSEFL